MQKSDKYVIIKRDLYHRPKSQGYTGVLVEAGVFSLEEVSKYWHISNKYNPKILPKDPVSGWARKPYDGYAIHIDIAPEYTNHCCCDIIRHHEDRKIEILIDDLIFSMNELLDRPKGVVPECASKFYNYKKGRFEYESKKIRRC